jgi:hypothetical protein
LGFEDGKAGGSPVLFGFKKKLKKKLPVTPGLRIKETNKNTLQKTHQWISNHVDPSLRFFIIEEQELPIKDAGAGLARKIGMDEAVWRFDVLDRPTGYILSLDADSLCDPDYFTAIEDTLNRDSDINGFDIYFEHPVSGREFNEKIYQGITEYELHLRYVNQMIGFSGFPYAHHTVGSCFGVRVDASAVATRVGWATTAFV